MTINKILILIIIFLIIILYYIISNLNNIYYYENHEYIKYKYIYTHDIINKLNTGDLVLFSAHDYDPINRLFSNLRYSHVGMVIKDNKNKYYIIELVHNDYIYNNELYYNVNIFDLKKRIKYYPGDVYISSYNKPNTINTNLLNYIIQNKDDIKYSTIMQNIQKILLNKHFHNNYHCAEFIAYLLDFLKIYDFSNVHKKNIMDQIIKLCNGIIYTEPIRVIDKNNKYSLNQEKIINYC
jgi:hypothetical protein